MKKYSEKFINDYKKLNKVLIGLEFEFFTKDLSFYKTLEVLNNELSPVKVHGFRQYHPDFKPSKNDFIITPDLSGGSNMVELVTGPLEYSLAKFYLVKILNFIDLNGWTNDRCSIHYNISIIDDDKDLNDLNILKMILNIDEDEIYSHFPSRKGNIYAKTVKTIIPYREYDFHNISILTVKNSLRLPSDKYYGINFLNILNPKESQRVEFRYIGGKDYQKNIGKIVYFLDKFSILTVDCCDVGFNDNDVDKLEEYLDININRWKSLSKYDNFLVNYPTIQLQIDQISEYTVVSSYYPKIFTKLFNLLDNCYNLNDCIINWVTSNHKLELVDADVKTNFTISDIELINCNLVDSLIDNCVLNSCDIKKSHLTNNKIDNSDIVDSKLLNCKVVDSTIGNSFFMNGYLDSTMNSGVFRSGELGPNAILGPDVQIVQSSENFFNTKYDTDDMGKYNKDIKGFKK
jgi:hypothetical protein